MEEAECSARPRYDPFTLSTAKIQHESLNITYDTGNVLGTYFTDNIRISSLVAKHVLFSVAAATYDRGVGIFSISAKQEGDPPTIVDTLVAQGQIASHTYSIDLRSINETGTSDTSTDTDFPLKTSASGSIVFGGIDTEKYKSLTKVPSNHFRANLTRTGMTLPSNTAIDFPLSPWRGNASHIQVLFDSGTPTNILPNELYFAIGDLYSYATPYTHAQGCPVFKVPCDAPDGSFDYSFGDYTIKISFADSLYKDDAGVCSFGFSLRPHDEWEMPYVLGAAFMRGAYMVFDGENDEIWMVESADCGEDIVAMRRGKDAVLIGGGCEAEARSAHDLPSTLTFV